MRLIGALQGPSIIVCPNAYVPDGIKTELTSSDAHAIFQDLSNACIRKIFEMELYKQNLHNPNLVFGLPWAFKVGHKPRTKIETQINTKHIA